MIPTVLNAWFSSRTPRLSFVEVCGTFEGKYTTHVFLHVADSGYVYKVAGV